MQLFSAMTHCICLALTVSTLPAESPQRETRMVQGWTLHIRQDLLLAEPQLTAQAIELLDRQLEEIVRVVPAPAVLQLREVPLYFSPTYPGTTPRAEYHPDENWLKDNGRDPVMARAVEFSNIGIFEEDAHRMPNFALHELAHAYHDRVLSEGFGNAEIQKAYALAQQSQRYEKVARRFGNGRAETVERSYALTSPMEYFAESTEAYFSTNDFFPFQRSELQQHDPEMTVLLMKLWRCPTPE